MSRWRGHLALLCCLVVVAAIALVTADREESVPVSYADVVVGETGVASTFDVHVLDVRLAQAVQRDELSEPLAADGRFVVVDISLDARTKRLTLVDDVWLLTASGHRYAPRPELISAHPPMVEPGFTTTGTYVFHVPADRVPGARLVVEPATPLFLMHDITVRVDLGLTEDTPVLTDPVTPGEPTTEVTV